MVLVVVVVIIERRENLEFKIVCLSDEQFFLSIKNERRKTATLEAREM